VSQGVTGTQDDGNGAIDVKSKWGVATTGGDPLNAQYSNQDLTLHAHETSSAALGADSNFMVVLIDGPTAVSNSDMPGLGDTYMFEGTAETQRTTALTNEHAVELGTSGYVYSATHTIQSEAPTVHQNARTITSVWDDSVTLPNKLVASQVAVFSFLTLLRDTVRLQYTAYNQDTVSHTVGFRLQMAPNATNGYVYLPGSGYQYSEAQFDKPNIPSTWFTYDNLPNAGYKVGARMIMSGPADATSPDHLVIGNSATLLEANNNQYVYTPNATQTVTNGVSPVFLEYWNPVVLAPGQSTTVVQYFGLTGAAENFGSPYVLATEGPQALSYKPGQIDPVTGAVTVPVLGPSPMTINGYVYNASGFLYNSNPLTMLQNIDSLPISMAGATATLALGTGMKLTGSQLTTQSLGSIANQSEAAGTWQVQATGLASGTVTYQMTGGGAPFGSKAVIGSVAIPPTPVSVPMTAGWQMVTLPFSFNNASLASIFTALQTGQAYLARWNPSNDSYDFAQVGSSDSFLQTVNPGAAYWIYLQPTALSASPFVLPASATVNLLTSATTNIVTGAGGATTTSTTYTPATASVTLHQGWNMIGNPFLYPVSYSEVQVLYGGLVYRIGNAVLSGVLPSTTIFSYNPGAGAYSLVNPTQGTLLEPMVGYWMYSNYEGVTLVFSAPAIPNAQVLTQ
jgi:hypothetical protein